MKIWTVYLPVLLLAGLFLTCRRQKTDPQSAVAPPAAAPASSGLELKDRLSEGKEFPRLSVADHLGNRYNLYTLLSKPKNVVLLVDARCPACAEEAETLQRFALRRPDLNVLGVSKDSLSAVLAFKKRHGLVFPILLDVEEKLVPDYRRVTFPTLILVGPDKRIIKLYEGGIPPSEAGTLLQTLLGN